MGKRIDWEGAWKVIISLCITAIGELALIDISVLPVVYQWAYLFIGIGFFIISFALVQWLWTPVTKKIKQINRKLNQKRTTPEIHYSFKQVEDMIYLRIESIRKNDKLVLRLDFRTPEPMWLINEKDKYAIQVQFVNMNQKMMYINRDVNPDTLVELPQPIAKIGEDGVILSACGWDASIPFGRYLYEFFESGDHRGQHFGKSRKFFVEFTKDGEFTYEERT